MIEEKQKMKNFICNTLYIILVTGVPSLFTINGFGVTTWQWWVVAGSICASYIVGGIRATDFGN
jgi:hypothetical protein